MEKLTRGFLIYAHNNEEIDYGKIAVCCALMIKGHLEENTTCLVADQGTYDYMKSSMGEELVAQAFNHIKITDWSFQESSTKKQFNDTLSANKTLTWHNTSRSSAYEYSPFDETIVLDSDVLVQDNMFDKVWGNDEDVLINKEAITLMHEPPRERERRLESSSLTMYWATMIYFKKSERAKMLFDLVDHIKEKYAYYQHIYEFPGSLYRNDFAFSIAIHMLSGFQENQDFKSFPNPKILSSFDVDELISVEKGVMKFLMSSEENVWSFLVTKIKGITVHVMNKYSLVRQADTIISIYR